MISRLNKHLSGISVVVVLLCVSPFLLSAHCIGSDKEKEKVDNNRYSCVEVPEYVVFCGDTIDLTRYDRHERMDRELMAFSYMHST